MSKIVEETMGLVWGIAGITVGIGFASIGIVMIVGLIAFLTGA